MYWIKHRSDAEREVHLNLFEAKLYGLLDDSVRYASAAIIGAQP